MKRVMTGENGNRDSEIGSRVMSIKSLEMLDAWKKAKEFALLVYRGVLPLLPSEEKWNLNQQLRRSSNSVPANIAEGYGWFYYQDNKGHNEPGAHHSIHEDIAPYEIDPSESPKDE